MSNSVFISYSRANIEFVKAIEAQLVKAGIQTWVDWRDIPAGANWRQALYDGLIASDVVLIFLSPTFMTSENCRIECYLARRYGKRIIPVVVEELEECLAALPKHDETKGLEDIYFVNYASHHSVGYPISDDFLFNLILDAIHEKPRAWYTSSALYYISFSSKDALFAGQLATDLTAANIDIFFAPLSCPAAVDWRAMMSRAMMQAKALIVCISPSSAQGLGVKREVLFAHTRRLPIFPVVTEDTANSQVLVEEMSKALQQTYEMRLLADVNWLYPHPSYGHLRDSLTALIKRQS